MPGYLFICRIEIKDKESIDLETGNRKSEEKG